MSEKKNNDYEKPESKGVGGEELEDVSGGARSTSNDCMAGNSAGEWCATGPSAHDRCRSGSHPATSWCEDGSDGW